MTRTAADYREDAEELATDVRMTDNAAPKLAEELAFAYNAGHHRGRLVPGTTQPAALALTASMVEALRALLGSLPYAHQIDGRDVEAIDDGDSLLFWLDDYRDHLAVAVRQTAAERAELHELRAQRTATRAWLGLPD
jgi:hypothetical protein